jgi:AcrR family transcriptional regulator
MPARPKTTDSEIVHAARQLVERHGRDGFSMKDVAAAVGIRAPSLYGRFKDRSSLLGDVELEICSEIAALLTTLIVADDPEATLMAQAQAYRRLATTNPNCYSLIFDIHSVPTEAGTKARAAALAPAMPSLAALVGDQQALMAARVLAPFMHGFVSMEIAKAFRLGGGLDAAFENGVATIIRGLAGFARD